MSDYDRLEPYARKMYERFPHREDEAQSWLTLSIDKRFQWVELARIAYDAGHAHGWARERDNARHEYA